MTTPWVERREIGPCVLYQGDCLALLTAGVIPPDAAIVADPPYGIGYQHGGGGKGFWKAKTSTHFGPDALVVNDDRPYDPGPWLDFCLVRSARRGSSDVISPPMMALCGADNFAHLLPPQVGCFYTWDKSAGAGPADSFADSEIIWMGRRNARRIYRHLWKGRMRKGVGEDCNARLHVMQKPVGLMAWIIETLRVPVGNVVCDPYMGSGTTGLASIRTGRPFIGIEIDPAHYATACARIEKAWAAAQGSPTPGETPAPRP